MSDIFHEVEEEVRREHYEKLWKKYGNYVIAVASVLVLGVAYGWKLGAASMLLYLAEGAIGLPVFSGTPERGIGLAYMMGPTGGYLAGFLVAAIVTGAMADRGMARSLPSLLVLMLTRNSFNDSSKATHALGEFSFVIACAGAGARAFSVMTTSFSTASWSRLKSTAVFSRTRTMRTRCSHSM